MKRVLAGVSAALLLASAAKAGPVQSYGNYRETTVAMTGAYVQVWTGASSPNKLVLADNAGTGCSWSLNATPIANEGVPFSIAGGPGSYVFDAPVPTNPIYAKCPGGAVLTVVTS